MDFLPPELRKKNVTMVASPPRYHIKVNADVYQTSRVSFEGCLGLKAHFVSYIITLGLAVQQDLIICCLGEL